MGKINLISLNRNSYCLNKEDEVSTKFSVWLNDIERYPKGSMVHGYVSTEYANWKKANPNYNYKLIPDDKWINYIDHLNSFNKKIFSYE